MNPQNRQDGTILGETVQQIRSVLGPEAESLKVTRAVVGVFFSGVKLSNGAGGVCFTPVKDIPEAVCCPSSARVMPDSGRLADQPVDAYLDDLAGGGPLKKALAIAVLNALSNTCWEKTGVTGYGLQLGADPLDDAAIPVDAQVVVVGALAPYIKMLKKRGNAFSILEKDTRTLRPDEMQYYVPPEGANEAIAAADRLIITGTTVLNDTLEGILGHARGGAEIILVGPTASMLPDAFFRRGVKAIGGITVTDADRLLDVLAEAGSGYHFYGKSAERLVIRQDSDCGAKRKDSK
ncbi:MAG: DUF364 domain-containing protein [Thermoleophilia bacterium]|nr:DUF364 domain-containing protein [Thermoleophilia bacterium]